MRRNSIEPETINLRATLRSLTPTTWLIATCCLVVGVIAFFTIRTFQPIEGLGNNDVAGIAYEADLLLRGQLPYRDSIELKAPGSFFLVAASWLLAGRSAATLNTACMLWVLLGAVAVFVAAFAIYGRKGSGIECRWNPNLATRCGALASGLYLASSGQFESNYSTWLMPPYAAAYAALIIGLRCNRLSAHIWTGVFAMIAYLCKHQAFVIGAVALIAWGWARVRGEPSARLGTLAGWISGALLASLPISLFYAYHGAFVDLLHGLIPLEKATEYSQRAIEISWVITPLRVARHVAGMFPTEVLWGTGALIFAGLTAINASTPAEQSRLEWLRAKMNGIEPVLPSLGFVLLSVIAGGLGGLRYYGHYAAQYLPGLAILAAHPVLWRQFVVLGTRFWNAKGWRSIDTNLATTAPWFLAIVAGIIIAAGGYKGVKRYERVLTGEVGVEGWGSWHPGVTPEQVGKFISERSAPTDTIHCWGWRAWPVYFWADRPAPRHLYKELGAVTEYNNNSIFDTPNLSRNTRLRWKSGSIADELLIDYKTRPPAFFVRATPFFPDVINDPLEESGELAALIAREYEFVKRIDMLQIYEHRIHKQTRTAASLLPGIR